MTINHQWLYVVTDTNRGSEMTPKELTDAKDGDNVAFIFNGSSADENNCQVFFDIQIIRVKILNFTELREDSYVLLKKHSGLILRPYTRQ